MPVSTPSMYYYLLAVNWEIKYILIFRKNLTVIVDQVTTIYKFLEDRVAYSTLITSDMWFADGTLSSTTSSCFFLSQVIMWCNYGKKKQFTNTVSVLLPPATMHHMDEDCIDRKTSQIIMWPLMNEIWTWYATSH